MPRHHSTHWLDHPRRTPEEFTLALLHFINATAVPSSLEWMTEGSCATSSNPEAWFPKRGPHDPTTRYALRVCATCPVRRECLSYVLDRHANGEALQGIWAGTTPRDRRRLVKRATA